MIFLSQLLNYCGISLIFFREEGVMFVDCQNFASSWGRNFVDGLLQYSARQFIILLNVIPRNPLTFNPHEQ